MLQSIAGLETDDAWDADEILMPQVAANALPFRVRVVRSEAQLQQVCALRAACYGHHLPEMGRALMEPEPWDRAPGTTILMAQDKASGDVVGTMRIHSNLHGPLPLHGAMKMPPSVRGHLLAEASRLAVQARFSELKVRLALFKALYLHCYASQVQSIVVGARKPLDRIYRSLGFNPLLEGDPLVPLPYANNIGHSVLVFDVLGAEREWHDTRHPLYEFMMRTYHPDIQIFSGGLGG